MKIRSVDLINGFLYPRVHLDVFGSGGESKSFVATLDTGFSGWVALPESEIDALRLPHFRTERITLADASEISADLHVADVFFSDHLFKVYVVSIGSVPLVGTSLLWNAGITLDMTPNGDIGYVSLNQ